MDSTGRNFSDNVTSQVRNRTDKQHGKVNSPDSQGAFNMPRHPSISQNEVSTPRKGGFAPRSWAWVLAALVAVVVGIGSWAAFGSGVSPAIIHAAEVAVVVALAVIAIGAVLREKKAPRTNTLDATEPNTPNSPDQPTSPPTATACPQKVEEGNLSSSEGNSANPSTHPSSAIGPTANSAAAPHENSTSEPPKNSTPEPPENSTPEPHEGSFALSPSIATLFSPQSPKNSLTTSERAILDSMPVDPSPLHIRCADLAIRHGLSSREYDVLVLLAQGMSRPEIERELVISMNTVKSHLRRIYQKLDIHSRGELDKILNE